jgi:hypothetical protein
MSLGSNTVVNLDNLGAEIGKLNIKAEVNPNKSVDKVKFLTPIKKTENNAPFAMCGDWKGNFLPCTANAWNVGGGANEVIAVPIVGGTEKEPVKVSFAIVGGASSGRSFPNAIQETLSFSDRVQRTGMWLMSHLGGS